MKMGDRIAALPTLLAQAVEAEVCRRRRERKLLFTTQPANWQEKLKVTNNKIMSIVYDLKQCALATANYMRKNITKVNGQLEFLGQGRGHEIMRICFQLHEDGGDPAGRGAYFLWSKNYEKREICCISATAERNGFDILKQAYAGQFIVCER